MSFPIVGIGASAGGLEAVTQLLKHLPADTGLAFVLVQHLDPAHESALAQILSRATTMSVREVTPDLPVEANHVYVIPPNKNLSIEDGVLKLPPRSQARKAQRAIDFFFGALAQDQHECAIGIILSGTASDGTLGLEAIKAEDGITFAQDESAAYDSMPRNAIAAGCVDFVLSPENMSKELARIAKHPSIAQKARRTPAIPDEAARRDAESAPHPAQENGLKQILLLLRNHSGVDFSLYKFNTIDRRITRRMVLNKKNTRDDYANFLRGNEKELEALYSDVLISVTSFFRDPEAFETLKYKVISKLLQQPRDEPLRAWVPGCSTGQEAYSIAMAFVECTDQAAGGPKLQIFASDLNEANLEKARAGFYPKNFVQDVSPERLRRFFVEEKGGYRISKSLREMCVFARQNLAGDPPFSRMDLISCRNVLIYLESDLQKKVLPIFHYALRSGGFLFLGVSETIGSFANLFETVDKKHKIFSKKTVPTPALRIAFARHQPEPMKETPAAKPRSQGLHPELNAQREADRVTLNRCAPPGVLIDAELQILQFRGDTSAYLKPPVGAATLNVVKMAREGLMPPLRAAIHQAKKENKITSKENIRVNQNGRIWMVNVEVIPLKNLKERSYLILFEEAKKAGRTVSSTPPPEQPSGAVRTQRTSSEQEESRRIVELERDLAEARDFAQAHQEQHEAANEELQAQSEELQSANEELQSINEELETSKEELESTNEELITVNEEMANRNAELNRLNSDLKNLNVSINTAIVLLGRDLTIRNFTPLAERTFNLLAADVGRPLGRIRHNLDCPDLEGIIAEVIDTVSVREREVRDKEGRWYSLRVRPYMTLDNRIDGAVLQLVDIDSLKQSKKEIEVARDYVEGILATTRNPLIVLTAELRIHNANAAFYRTFKVSPGETEGRLIYELGNGQWNVPKLREFLEEILPRNSFFNDFEVKHDFPGIGRRTILLNALQLRNEADEAPKRILLGIDDITDSKQLESMAEQGRLLDLSNDAITLCDWNNRISYWNKGAEDLYGCTRDEAVGKIFHELLHVEYPEPRQQIWAKLERDDRWSGEIVRTRRDGRIITVATRWTLARDAQGRPSSILSTDNDITTRKRTEAALRESESRLRAVIETAVDGIITIDEQRIISSVNPATESIFGYTASEMIGQNVRMLMPEPYRAEHDSYVANYLRTGQRKIIGIGREVQGRRKDGTTFPLDLAVTEIKLEGRRIFTGFVRDITERKQAEEALRESEASLKRSQEIAHLGSWELDLTANRLTWSDEVFHIFGLQPREFSATFQAFLERVHPDDRQKVGDAYTGSLREDRDNYDIEHRIVRKDTGEVRVVHEKCEHFRDATGKIIRSIGMVHDITAHKRAEAALRQAHDELEVRVQERTAELREMISELEHVSYAIAHDMRAPLRAIQGFADMLKTELTDGSPEERQDHLRRIMTAASRMDKLIQDALNYNKAVLQEMPLQPVDLSALLRGITETYPNLDKAEILVEPGLPAVLGNEALLTECFSNLLGNAVKFVAPGVSPRIRVRAEAGTGVVRIWVEDNGIGIPKHAQQRLFKMFERLTNDYEGNGIGLAIVRKVVERMGGKVGVESELGQGSRFWVELRLTP